MPWTSKPARNLLAGVRGVALAAALVVAPVGVAHEGHDHGEAPAAAPVEGMGGSRLVMSGERFELVGALDGQRLTLWLDRAADNAPVAGAGIELDIGGRTVAAKPQGDVYVAELPAPPAPGTQAVIATVLAGESSDLLVADWVIEAPAASGASGNAARGAASVTALPATTLAAGLGAGLAALLAAGGIGWLAGRRSRVAAH